MSAHGRAVMDSLVTALSDVGALALTSRPSFEGRDALKFMSQYERYAIIENFKDKKKEDYRSLAFME